MKKLSLLCLLIAAVLLAGCAKMPLREDYVKEATAPVVTPDETSGVVYFVRDSAFGGAGISYFIFEDTTKIGLLKSGTYFIHKTTPGKHTYYAETEARSSVTLDVEAGKTYYVEGSVGLGFLAGRPQLMEITEPVAKQYLPELEYIRLATPEEVEAYKLKEQEKNNPQGVSLN